LALRRTDALFFAVVAVIVAAGGLTVVLSSGSAAPRHISQWYVGTWRATGPMVGLQNSRLVGTPGAPAGVVRVTEGEQGLMVSMTGFRGVPSTPVAGTRDPLAVTFETPDTGQGVGNWELILRSPVIGGLRLYDPSTDSWSYDLTLVKQ